MQSDSACACFVRVGRCRFGSILVSHLGVILGAKFATILLFGRPGDQNRLTKERLKKTKKTGDFGVVQEGSRTLE